MKALIRRIDRLEQQHGVDDDALHICANHPPDWAKIGRRAEGMKFIVHKEGDPPSPPCAICGGPMWSFTLDLRGSAAFDLEDQD